MDFTESEKALAIAAIFNEGSLKRWFYARHPRQIDISLKLLAIFSLVVKILNAGAAQEDNPRFFDLAAVYQ